MVKIRLARVTRRGIPFYRIVAIDGAKQTRGAYLANFGFWNKGENKKEIDKKEIERWVAKGAQISPAVKKLL